MSPGALSIVVSELMDSERVLRLCHRATLQRWCRSGRCVFSQSSSSGARMRIAPQPSSGRRGGIGRAAPGLAGGVPDGLVDIHRGSLCAACREGGGAKLGLDDFTQTDALLLVFGKQLRPDLLNEAIRSAG